MLKYPNNKADVNAVNKLGLTVIHILLSKLLDYALLQNKQASQRPGKVRLNVLLNIFHPYLTPSDD